jgi:ribonuclease HII
VTVADPDLRFEKRLMRAGDAFVIGMDEVGRGAIAGELVIGVAMIDLGVRRVPEGLRDSKLLSEPRREQLAPKAARWAMFSATGAATNVEIDEIGLSRAIGLAAARAIGALRGQGAPVDEARVLLDGTWDYLNPALTRPMPVTTRAKADRDCASVAAASVIAKVTRDRAMIAAHDDVPHYGWVANKGYASAAHYAAIDAHGPHPLHRHTWLRTPSLFDLVAPDPPGGAASARPAPRA